jgi:FMN phosphatase YigB (HAD superfamily)
VRELGLEPAEIAYVGDRVDNDVEPAARAGLRAIFIRRGPWAFIQAGRENPPAAASSIDSLDELPAALANLS